MISSHHQGSVIMTTTITQQSILRSIVSTITQHSSCMPFARFHVTCVQQYTVSPNWLGEFPLTSPHQRTYRWDKPTERSRVVTKDRLNNLKHGPVKLHTPTNVPGLFTRPIHTFRVLSSWISSSYCYTQGHINTIHSPNPQSAPNQHSTF